VTGGGREVEELARSLRADLVLPELDVVNSWTLRGVRIHYLYVRHPVPLFFLEPLHALFRDLLVEHGVDPAASVEVGDQGASERKRVLSISTYEMRRNFGGGCKVPVRYLQFRWKEKGISLNFWTRGSRISLFKGFKLGEDPEAFIGGLLRKRDYPRYVVEDALRKGEVTILAAVLKKVQEGRERGWPLVL
jgi:hypothetical protein